MFSHSSAMYPGDHSPPLLCIACHGGNSETVNWPSPQYQPDCGACHANDYEQDEHKKYEEQGITFFYSVDELSDCTTSCHEYTDSTLTKIKDSEPGPEHRVTDGDF